MSVNDAPMKPVARPVRIALAYLLFGLLWIWLSDRASAIIQQSSSPWPWIDSIKGSLFVVVSAALIYWFSFREIRNLRRVNNLLQAIADETTDAVFVKDRDGKYLLFNPAASQFVGKPVSEVVGSDDTKVFDASSAARIRERDLRVMTSGRADTAEETITANGITRTYSATKAPYRDDRGQVIGVVGISRDVSVRRRAEIDREESERRFRELADAIPQIVWIASTDGALTMLNAKASAYTGIDTSSLLGWDWGKVIHGDDLERTVEVWSATVRTGAPQDLEFRIRRHDGLYRWHVCRQVLVKDSNGNPMHWYGTCTDVEDLKQAESALRYERTLLRTLIDSIPDLIFTKDIEGRFVLCNRALLSFVGAAVESEVTGKTVVDLFSAEHAQLVHDDDLRVIRDQQTIYDREVEAEDFRGKRTWRSVIKAPLRNQAGEVVGLVGISRDIQARKERLQALAASEMRLTLALSAAKMGVWEWHVQSDSVYWSPECHQILGFARQISGLDEFVSSIHPGDRERVHAMVMKSLNDGSDFVCEFRVVRPDGQILWISNLARVERSATGIAERMIGTAQDVTDRKIAQDALQERESQMRLFLEHVPVPVAMLDKDMRYLHVSQRWITDFRLEDQQISGKDHYQLFPELPDRWRQVHQRCLAGAVERCEEDQFVRLDGTLQWLRWEVRPWRQADGPIGGIIIFSEDITDRKRSQAEQRRLMLLIEHSRDFIGMSDLQGRLTYINSGGRRMIGLSPNASPQDTHFEDYVPPEWRTTFRENVISKVVSEGLWEGEMQLCHLETRQLIDVHRTVLMIDDPIEGAQWFATVTRDITEEKRSQSALRENEERYRRLVDVMPSAMFVQSNNKVVFCNPAFVKLMGAESAESLIGRDAFDFVEPEFHSLLRSRNQFMEDTGSPVAGIETRVLRPDGKAVPVYSVATPITGYGTNAILVAISDLTERERSMELLTNVLGSVNDAIMTITEVGQVTLANPATERMFGYSPNEVIGKNVKMLMPEPFRAEHDSYLQNFIRTGIAKVIGIGREVEALRKDGTTFPVELTVTEFRRDGGRHFTGVVRDITSRKRLEAQFHQSQKMEAIGRLAGGVAHDFNNLLTVINGYSDLLLMVLPSSDLHRDSITAIRDAGERAARLTQQLLAFSRKAIIEPKVLDINELVEESAKLLRRLIGEDITVSVVPDPRIGQIKADPGQLEQVIMNLMVNARDAMPTGGRLTIETHDFRVLPVGNDLPNGLRPGRYVQLVVRDTGHGMSPEVKAKIFEPFFTTKETGKGTGLGLAVVHGVITQCGGEISVTSEIGVGTAFTLLFPTVDSLVAGETVESMRLAIRGTETILLVEDEDAVRTIARIALETQGFTVIEASGGASAIQLVERGQHKFDLLITDVVMPQMGGRQLAQELRLRLPGLPILYMSGYTDDAVLQHGVESAKDAFIQKPFTPLGLARRARAVLDGE